MDKLMKFIWLLNAQVNSLHEPELLTKDALKKAEDFYKELKDLELQEKELELIKKELESSLLHIKEMSKDLLLLEDKLFNILEGVNTSLKTKEK